MPRTSCLDDPAIGVRAAELAAERLRAIIQCTCVRPDNGAPVDSSKCPVHATAAAAPATPAAAITFDLGRSMRPVDDDWATLKAEALAKAGLRIG